MPSLPNPLGPYRLERRLGGGGFADVWLAYDSRRGHQVALKVLHPHHANSTEVLQRFRREGEQMLKLRHRHIVGAYDVSVVAGYHTIAMPYLAGGSLADMLAKQRRLDLTTAAAIVGQVAAALDFVHPAIIHRDLKPSNVLLDGQGNCLVADFGVAHVSGESTLTPTGYQPGTPHYMAPEQVRPSLGRVGPATDVWALGVILYEMVCGRRPFDAEDSQAVMFQVVNDPPPWPGELKLALPAGMDAVMQRALAKNPRQRYQRAGELAQAVGEAARNAATRAPAQPEIGAGPSRTRTPTPPKKQAAPPARDGKEISRPVLLGASGGVVVLAILLLVFLLSRQAPSEVEPTPAGTAPVVADASSTATVFLPTSTLALITTRTAISPTSTLAATPPTATPAPLVTATPQSATVAPTRTPVRATAPPAPALAAPVIEGPENGFTADQGSITIRWQAVQGAQGYWVETRSERPGQTEWRVWPVGVALDIRLNFDDNASYFAQPPTEYFWRVAAMDGRGQPGAHSEVRRFVFNRPPVLEPTTPPDEPQPTSGPPTTTPDEPTPSP